MISWAWLSPKGFYRYAEMGIPYCKYTAIVLLCIGSVWGLFYSPADYQQGDMVRLMYIHVPAAIMSMAIYAAMGGMAILFLIWRMKVAGMMIGIMAEVGGMMALIALLTGSIWGKPTWGTFWVWDARLTSECILFFIYMMLLAIQAHIRYPASDKVLAIMTLVGLIDLPIIHYSVYWWHTLHQGSSFPLFAKPTIHSSIAYPLYMMVLGFMMYTIWTVLYQAQTQILMREYRQDWVKHILGKKT